MPSPVFHKILQDQVMRKKVLAFLILAVTCVPSITVGSVRVYPKSLFVNPPSRSAAITLTNETERRIEVWITFDYQYPVSFSDGEVELGVDGTSGVEPDASSWLRAVPQRVFIEPLASQTVRIIGSPSGVGGSEESWSRVVINSKPAENIRARTANKQGITAELVTATAIPMHFRHGTVRSGVDVRNFGAASGGDNKLVVNAQFNRTGNAAMWGSLNFELLSAPGRVAASWSVPLVVYKKLSYSRSLDIGNVPPGQYTLNLSIDNKHPGLVPAARVPSAPVRTSIPVNIP